MKYRISILSLGFAIAALGTAACARDDAAFASTELTSGQLAAQPAVVEVDPSDPDRSGATARAQADADDLLLTQEIRKAVGADDTLSSVAKGVTVTSERGHVRLEGRVASERERHTIARKALYLAGIGNVKDELEVQNP